MLRPLHAVVLMFDIDSPSCEQLCGVRRIMCVLSTFDEKHRHSTQGQSERGATKNKDRVRTSPEGKIHTVSVVRMYTDTLAEKTESTRLKFIPPLDSTM